MVRDLKADLELCQRATPGPWFAYRTASGQVTVQCPPGWICTMSDKGDMPTARFIAAAREGWPEAIRRAMVAEQGMEEAEARLVADELEALDFLWQEYVQADPATLTEDAKELAAKVRQKVLDLAGVARLAERIEELESAISRVVDRLQDHDHESVYGPYGFAGLQCIVHDGVLCDTLDDLQAVLDKAGEG